jgi:hypothetical protein
MPMWRRATFWLALASAAICFCDYLGSGLANMILVRLNPLMDAMLSADPYSDWIADWDATRLVTDSVTVRLRYTAYGIHFGSFLLAGLLVDGAIRAVRRRKR